MGQQNRNSDARPAQGEDRELMVSPSLEQITKALMTSSKSSIDLIQITKHIEHWGIKWQTLVKKVMVTVSTIHKPRYWKTGRRSSKFVQCLFWKFCIPNSDYRPRHLFCIQRTSFQFACMHSLWSPFSLPRNLLISTWHSQTCLFFLVHTQPFIFN